MALYLIHEPLLKWMAFAIKKWRKESIDEFYMKRIQATPLSPLWGNIIILLEKYPPSFLILSQKL